MLIFGQADGIIFKQGVHRELRGVALITYGNIGDVKAQNTVVIYR